MFFVMPAIHDDHTAEQVFGTIICDSARTLFRIRSEPVGTLVTVNPRGSVHLVIKSDVTYRQGEILWELVVFRYKYMMF